jgi:hypothetical protein
MKDFILSKYLNFDNINNLKNNFYFHKILGFFQQIFVLSNKITDFSDIIIKGLIAN